MFWKALGNPNYAYVMTQAPICPPRGMTAPRSLVDSQISSPIFSRLTLITMAGKALYGPLGTRGMDPRREPAQKYPFSPPNGTPIFRVSTEGPQSP